MIFTSGQDPGGNPALAVFDPASSSQIILQDRDAARPRVGIDSIVVTAVPAATDQNPVVTAIRTHLSLATLIVKQMRGGDEFHPGRDSSTSNDRVYK